MCFAKYKQVDGLLEQCRINEWGIPWDCWCSASEYHLGLDKDKLRDCNKFKQKLTGGWGDQVTDDSHEISGIRK